MADEVKNKETDGAEQNQQGQESEPKVVTLTEEELNKRLQSEADKRVTDALKTAKSSWEKEHEKKVKEATAEAERLAKLNEDERQKELDRKREEDLTQREKALHLKEMENEAMKILGQRSLPVTFAKQLLGNSAEDTQTNIADFEKEWNIELDRRVAERLKGKVPPADDQTQKKSDVNAQIRRMARL